MFDLDETISIEEAAQTLVYACFYTNDNADPTGIMHATDPTKEGEFIITLYHGCNITNIGRQQKFKIKVMSID